MTVDDQRYNQIPQIPPEYQRPPAEFIPPVLSPLVAAPNKKRKGFIIGGVIAAALVVLAGAGAAAYHLWYQTPDKIITDAMMNAVHAKSLTYTGSFNTTGDTTLKVELKGAAVAASNSYVATITFPIEDKEYTIETSALFDSKGDLYLKAKNIASLVESYRENLPPQSMETINKFVAKIDGKWIKITAKDLASFSEDTSKKQACITDAIEKYKNDDAAMAEVADVYKKNRFVVADERLGSKDGSIGYTITLDDKKAKAFASDIKNTKIYKTLHTCNPDFKIDEDSISSDQKQSDDTETRVELWVERWTHQITELNAHGTSDGGKTHSSLVWKPTFNEEVTISAPKESITLKQLQADIEELLAESMAALMPATQEEATFGASSEL